MQENRTTSFDVLATNYDQSFTASFTGYHQRAMVRKWLSEFFKDKASLNILEINCGTGEDALWLASLGHKVIATDASLAMIETAKRKLLFNPSAKADFRVCTFAQLKYQFAEQKFDLVFSNFSGLNCISPAELKSLSGDILKLLNPNGFFALVVFGKHCLWESFYYLAKLDPKHAFRRWTNRRVTVFLKENDRQDIFYYSIRHIKQLLNLKLVAVKPVGLFIPPSYLEGKMKKHKMFSKLLIWLECHFGSTFLSAFADHTYILLKNEQ
jgi:ubiquinone/menaquinone biosynthesis C-methylase UbiE